jgi:hypothetical protein
MKNQKQLTPETAKQMLELLEELENEEIEATGVAAVAADSGSAAKRLLAKLTNHLAAVA